MGNVEVTPGAIDLRKISPFAFQWYATDFFEAYKKLKGGAKFSPARLTLLAQAVELAAKSLHVAQGKREAELRCDISHDLIKACDSGVLSAYELALTSDELTELVKMNDLNMAKAFEYFWFEPHPRSKKRQDKKQNEQPRDPEIIGILHALEGRPDLPDESVIERLLIKLLTPSF